MAKHKNELSTISILKANVERTNELGDYLYQVLETMESSKKEVKMMKRSVEKDIGEFKAEMTDMVEEVRNERELTYEQQKVLQSIVHTRSNDMTREYYDYADVMSELFKKKKGQFIRAMWKRLKTAFDVPRYTSIRKVDFDKAVNTLNHIELSDIDPSEIKDKRSWNIPGLFPDEDNK